MSQIFISYYHEGDYDFAIEVVAKNLKEQKFKPWFFSKHQKAGIEWHDEIEKQIKLSCALIVIMSPEARVSDYVTYEWIFARGAGIPVIPIIYKQTTLHFGLEILHRLDFINPQARPWEELFSTLKEIAEKRNGNSQLPSQNGNSQPPQQNGYAQPSQLNGSSHPPSQNGNSHLTRQNSNSSKNSYYEKSGDAFDHNGSYEDARRMYNLALQQNPLNVRIHEKMGETLMKLGNQKAPGGNEQKNLYDEAAKHYSKVLEFKQSSLEVYKKLFECLQLLNDNKKALAISNEICKKFPRNTFGYINGFKLYIIDHDYEHALAISEEMCKYIPDITIGYLNAGIASFHLNKLDHALKCFEQVLILDSKNSQAYYYQGHVYEKLRRYHDALTAYNKAIVCWPENAYAHYYKGLLLEKRGKKNEAKEAYRFNPELKKIYNNHL